MEKFRIITPTILNIIQEHLPQLESILMEELTLPKLNLVAEYKNYLMEILFFINSQNIINDCHSSIKAIFKELKIEITGKVVEDVDIIYFRLDYRYKHYDLGSNGCCGVIKYIEFSKKTNEWQIVKYGE